MSGLVLAVDIGGTKFAVALVDSDGDVRMARRTATPPGGDAPTLWKALDELIDSLLDGAVTDGLIHAPTGAAADGEVVGVGIGCGGPMSWPEGAVSPLNMPGWRGFPLRARLAERFPGVPVRIHNDAVCLAAAEHWRGAGRGSANMLGMVVSTGVGGGLILGGRLIDGGSGNAGHIGHVVVEPGGPVCGCGGRGCLEAIARGPGLAAWAVEQGWTPGGAAIAPSGGAAGAFGGAAGAFGGETGAFGGETGRGGSGAEAFSGEPEAFEGEVGAFGGDTGVLGSEAGGPAAGLAHEEVEATGPAYVEAAVASGRQLALDAAAGDEIAVAAMNRAGHALGLAIASATNLCDLDVVTIGGGLSQAGPLLFEPLEAALREHTRMEFARRLRVVPASLGQDAGLVGAAALILAADRYWSH